MIVKIFLSIWELSVVTHESELVTSFHQNSSATGFKTWPGWPWYFRSQIYFGSELIDSMIGFFHDFWFVLWSSLLSSFIIVFSSYWGGDSSLAMSSYLGGESLTLSLRFGSRSSSSLITLSTSRTKVWGLGYAIMKYCLCMWRQHVNTATAKNCVNFMETFAIFSMYSFTNWEE